MSTTLTREQARRLDRLAVEHYGMTSAMLMENAGRGAADLLCRLGIDGPVAICCGAGNNGGDGFVIARHLDLRGHQVHVLLFAGPEKLTGDAQLNYRIIERSGIAILRPTPAELARALTGCAWIVDAILGSGAHGEPRPPLDEVIDQLNASGIPILAVDLPSGLDCDTGEPASHTIRATHTCTFVAPKHGFQNPAAAALTGTVHVADIGAPRKLVDAVLTSTGASSDD